MIAKEASEGGGKRVLLTSVLSVANKQEPPSVIHLFLSLWLAR